MDAARLELQGSVAERTRPAPNLDSVSGECSIGVPGGKGLSCARGQQMQIMLTERVKTALQTLGHDERERVNTWFGYLRNWEDDPFVGSRSVALEVRGEPVYMFRTGTPVRISYP